MKMMQWVSSVTAALAPPGQTKAALKLPVASVFLPFIGYHLKAGLGWSLLAALVLSGSGCAWLDAKQRNIIYRPTPGVPADFAGLRATDERYFLTVPADVESPWLPAPASAVSTNAPSVTASITASANTPAQIEMWWLPHADPTAPTLLYYHGTFRNLYQNLPKIDALREAGFTILAVEYRGWGRSTVIVPSEQTIVQDAQIAFEELKRREPRATHRVIYGHSMGSGVAVEIASKLKAPRDYAALILESAFTNLPDIAAQANFLGRLVSSFNNERFASVEKIVQVRVPLLMLHGAADKTVPVQLGQKLFAAANTPKVFVSFELGGHSNLQEVSKIGYQKALADFKLRFLTSQ